MMAFSLLIRDSMSFIRYFLLSNLIQKNDFIDNLADVYF
jgi:hypothetical protein